MFGPPLLEARRSQSKPDRGIMKTAIEAVNQDGQTVMRATAINFLRVRPDPDGPDRTTESRRAMLYAFGFERVGVLAGDLY